MRISLFIPCQFASRLLGEREPALVKIAPLRQMVRRWKRKSRLLTLEPRVATHSLSVARCPIQLHFSIELKLIWAVFIERLQKPFCPALIKSNLLRALPYYVVVKEASVVQPAQRRTAKTTMLRADAGRASSPPSCYCPCILSSLVHMPQVTRSGVAWRHGARVSLTQSL